MKFVFTALFITVFSFGAFAQDMAEKKKATPEDNAATWDADGMIERGAPLGDSEMVSLKEVMMNPEKFAGKSVLVKGVIVRSCKMEGCWAELAPSMDSKSSVRVNFTKRSWT